MKVLIYGSSGWIGGIFKDLMNKNNIHFYCGKSRVDCKSKLIEEINTIKPTHVISFIGRTHGTIGNKKIATIGDSRYDDYPTFIDKKGLSYANQKKKLYRLRHKNDINNKNGNGYWSSSILW